MRSSQGTSSFASRLTTVSCDIYIYHTLYSRDRYEIIGFCKIPYFKSVINASKLLKQYSTLAKQSGKSTASFLIFKPRPNFVGRPASQAASLPYDRLPLGAGLQIFHRLCTVASHLRIFRSAEHSSTAPSSFLLTITGLPSSSLVC